MSSSASPSPSPADERPLVRSTYAVWELTLRCNLKCIHCGSRAGAARCDELSTAEALDLVHQMADLGIREVSLIGGEAFLRRDWLEIAREITRSGMVCGMTTGGYGLGPKMAEQIAEAGLEKVSVSIDGLEATHDFLRGRQGSYTQCFVALRALRAAGIQIATNTQINRLSAPELPRLQEILRDAGVRMWQTQLTVPMGNAADHAEILLQPWELLDLFPLLSYLLQRGIEEGPRMMPGNNIGFFGPYERMMRTHPNDAEAKFWQGCAGGVLTLGIEADGAIKPDPSLPTAAYTGGNIRERPLRDIVYGAEQLTFNDDRGTEHLWGFCEGCEFADICRGGDTWTAHVFFDRRGNNPFCHHRSLYHAASGQRERLELAVAAEGVPFDNGVFDIALEPCDAPLPNNGFSLADVDWPEPWLEADPELPPRLAAERDRAVEVWRQTRLRRPPEGAAATASRLDTAG
ncbi:MAG: radical SAM protein [Acidobacteriota bacterium]